MTTPNMSGVTYGPPQVLFTLAATPITKVGILGAITWPRGCRGRVKLRFRTEGADKTLGDGTSAHTICIIGQMAQHTVIGGVSKVAAPELIGFAGIGLGGALPVVPMLDAAGANPREFAQIVELSPGYASIGLAGFAADEATVGAFSLIAEPIIEEE